MQCKQCLKIKELPNIIWAEFTKKKGKEKKMRVFARSNIILEDDIVDGSLGVSQQRHWHPSEMTCADQRVDPSFEAAEAVNIH